VLGCGHGVTHMNISSMPDLTVTGAKPRARPPTKIAQLSAKDIDLVELYDAFTINNDPVPEDLGFCRKGEGGAFVSGGNIAPGGKLPVNTNGGGLSTATPAMYGLLILIEGVRQLRGEMRRAAGQEARRRDGAWQWRRVVRAGERDFGECGDGVAPASS